MPSKRKVEDLLAEDKSEIVALASTLGLTGAPDLQDDNEYFYEDETTAWDNQHYEVRVQKY